MKQILLWSDLMVKNVDDVPIFLWYGWMLILVTMLLYKFQIISREIQPTESSNVREMFWKLCIKSEKTEI